MITTLMLVIAFVCFVIACLPAAPGRLNYTALGLAVYMVALLLGAPWATFVR